MKRGIMSLTIISMLLAPLVALAQMHVSHATPAPGAPGFAAGSHGEPDDDGDELAWFDDDLFGFGMGGEFDIEIEGMHGGPGGDEAFEAGPGPGGPHEMTWQEGGGDGEQVRRVIVRRGPGMRGMQHAGMAMRLAALDLTDAQRAKMRDIHEAHARKAIQRRADMQLARMDLHKLMRAEKVDAAAVNAQIDKLARMRADAAKAAFDTHMQARAVLTPEQLKKLRSAPQPMMKMEHRMEGEPH